MVRSCAILQMLNGGHRATEIADYFSVSRERIRQLIKRDIDYADLHIPCRTCGQSMTAEHGLRYRRHHSCRSDYYADSKAERQRRQLHHQRNGPDGEFEQVALDVYSSRGYAVLWMPHQAPFDYVVNGCRVDVKGANLNMRGRWRFKMSLAMKSQRTTDAEYPHDWLMSNRCEVVHCIGTNGDTYIHWLMPSTAVDGLTALAIPASPKPTHRRKWWQHRNRWELLERNT